MDFVVRTAVYLDLMALFGLAAFGLYGLRGVDRGVESLIDFRRAIICLAVAGLALAVLSFVLVTAAMADVAPWAIDRASVDAMLWDTSLGTAYIVRVAALLVAALSGLFRRLGPRALSLASAGGAVALASLAWGGHGAADDGTAGWVHLVADCAHLLAAGLWVGAISGLGGLILCRSAARDGVHLQDTHRALAQFSGTGSLIVAAVILSGLINSWFLVGLSGLPVLLDSPYGRLLTVKLALFGLMLAIAAHNRFGLVPALARSIARRDDDSSIARLRWSLIMEFTVAAAILAVVAWLGTLEPPI